MDGLRGALIDVSHFSAATDIGVLAAVAAAFLALAAHSFSKIQV